MKAKELQLKKYKALATALFIIMLVGFIVCALLLKTYNYMYLKAIKAFCEAAMVGALADWFAVTAIFRKPMHLNIPHTNLIEKNKEDIGENLGAFVEENFLNKQNISTFIEKIDFVDFIKNWTLNNSEVICTQLKKVIKSALLNVNDKEIENLLTNLIQEKVNAFNSKSAISPVVDFVIANNYHQDIIIKTLSLFENYSPEIKKSLKNAIDKKALGLGSLLSDSISNWIVDEAQKTIDDIINNPNNKNRLFIEKELVKKIESLKHDELLMAKINTIKNNLFIEFGPNFIKNIIKNGKDYVLIELEKNNSNFDVLLQNYLVKILTNLNENEIEKKEFNTKIKGFLVENIAKNSFHVSNLIQKTVKDWNGKELSNKIELEVGKDLQFIRINGTLIGGLIGLVIFYLSHYLI